MLVDGEPKGHAGIETVPPESSSGELGYLVTSRPRTDSDLYVDSDPLLPGRRISGRIQNS